MLGDAEAISFTDIEEAFSAISGSDAKDITLTMKQVVSLSSPLDLEIADTVTFKNPDWLVCHPDSNKPTLRIKSGTFIIDKVNLEGDRKLVENLGVKDNGTAIADGAEVIMYMPVGEDSQPAYINMKDVSSARIASASDTIPIYFDTFEHAMNHLDQSDQTVIVMETADADLNGVLSYTSSDETSANSFKLKGLAKASDITIGADKNFNITAGNFSNDGITVVKNDDYKFNLVSLAGAAESLTSFTGSSGVETVNNYIAKLTINGKGGADNITNYAASVTIDGGTGDDRIYHKSNSDVTISGGKGNDILVGNKGNDYLSGGAGNDTLKGDAGDDKLFGGNGNDSLNGGKGNDSLNGGFGDDILKGGKGNDILIGGAGNDSLWGDAGADIFVYSSGNGKDIIYGFDNNDTLTLDIDDFKVSYKNKAVTLKFDDGGSVTLKDFTATTFNINDDTYQISGNKFVKTESK